MSEVRGAGEGGGAARATAASAASAASGAVGAATSRRPLIGWLAAVGALAASYGTAGFYALRFLYPGHLRPVWREVYVGSAKAIPVGSGRRVTLPTGAALRLQRTREGFSALSDTCPHLGCKVHWEPANDRFYCPCHAGAFDASGKAIAGPPQAEGKDLARYETLVRGDGVYIRYREA